MAWSALTPRCNTVSRRDASPRTPPRAPVRGDSPPKGAPQRKEERILDFARLNTYHVGMIPYFLERLRKTADDDGTLLDNTVLLYGSPMGDSNQHNHKRVPFFVAGHAGGALKGGVHVKAPNGTPLANAMLSVLHALGLDDLPAFGDSTGAIML